MQDQPLFTSYFFFRTFCLMYVIFFKGIVWHFGKYSYSLLREDTCCNDLLANSGSDLLESLCTTTSCRFCSFVCVWLLLPVFMLSWPSHKFVLFCTFLLLVDSTVKGSCSVFANDCTCMSAFLVYCHNYFHIWCIFHNCKGSRTQNPPPTKKNNSIWLKKLLHHIQHRVEETVNADKT